MRSKRRQVKNACTNCQKACKKCDDARPCLRCVTYGIFDNCVDSQRKERKKGVKRGPYKKRDGKGTRRSTDFDVLPVNHIFLGNTIEQSVSHQALPASNNMSPPSGSPPLMGPYLHFGFPPGYYGQYPPPTVPKPGEGAPLYPQYFLAPVPVQPQASQGGQEGDPQFPPQSYYPAYVTQLGPPPVAYPQYMVPRPDGQPSGQYAVYGAPVYQRPSSAGGSDGEGISPDK